MQKDNKDCEREEEVDETSPAPRESTAKSSSGSPAVKRKSWRIPGLLRFKWRHLSKTRWYRERQILVLVSEYLLFGNKDGDFYLNKKMNYNLSSIKRIEERAGEIKGSVSLAQGIPSFPSHPLVRKKVIEAINNGKVDRYSSVAGIPELRSIIRDKLGGKYSLENEIIIVGGAMEGLSATINALFKEKDEIIVFTPAYPYYFRICEMAGIKAISVKLDESRGWSVSTELVEKAINKNTKGIIICNPNNPTGSILSKKELLKIGRLARDRNLIIISDDVYEKISFSENPVFGIHGKDEMKERVVRIVSLSKSFALSGWRIGFLHGPKSLIGKIIRVHDNLINCAPVVSQYAALAALEKEDDILPYYLKEYRKRRAIMEEHLLEMEDFLEFTRPSGTYFFFPRIKGASNSEKICLDMLERVGLAVVPGEEFGPGGEGHIRLCFGKSEEEIREGMSRMKRYFNEKNRP